MASSAPNYTDLLRQIKSGNMAPIYVLHGAEGYYIDELVKAFEAQVPEGERDFNLYQLYAPQVDPQQVVEACMRYPMMSDRQIVILKEAQSKAKFIDALAGYAAKPNPQTVFVVVGRGENVTGANFMKAMKASGGVVFESKRLYESQVGPVIESLVKEAGLTIDSKAKAMLTDYVGTDLSRIHNEVVKIATVMPKGSAITPQLIDKLIGVNKDFNNFELMDALANRDSAKAFRIIDYFRKNPKNNSAIPTCAMIFKMFQTAFVCLYVPQGGDVYTYAGIRSGSGEARRIDTLRRHYRPVEIMNAISACRRFDVRSKGVGSRADQFDLQRELIFSIIRG